MSKLSDTHQLIHQIFIFDANLAENFIENNRDKKIRNLISDLLKELEMEPLSDLKIDDAIDPSAPGWTFIQPITTSHISCHYFISNPSHIHFDLYSCKKFDWKTVVKILNQYFSLADWSANSINRDIYNRSNTNIRGNKSTFETC